MRLAILKTSSWPAKNDNGIMMAIRPDTCIRIYETQHDLRIIHSDGSEGCLAMTFEAAVAEINDALRGGEVE